jgi:IS5 family transposase
MGAREQMAVPRAACASIAARTASRKSPFRQKRDAEMHQSKKGNDWHFGLKAHIGVDATSGLVHTVIGTAGNVSDVTQARAVARR